MLFRTFVNPLKFLMEIFNILVHIHVDSYQKEPVCNLSYVHIVQTSYVHMPQNTIQIIQLIIQITDRTYNYAVLQNAHDHTIIQQTQRNLYRNNYSIEEYTCKVTEAVARFSI